MITNRVALTYEDLSEPQLDELEAANLRYLGFLGLRGSLDEQAESDRVAYGHLLTFSASGEGCVSEGHELEFLIAVTGFPREVCQAYLSE